MTFKVLKTRLKKPKDKELSTLKTILMENKYSWIGDWYAWEHEVKQNKFTTNKWRLNKLLGENGYHEIYSVERNDGTVFNIGDVIRHNQTDEYNKVIIDSFRIVPHHITKEEVCEVSFNLEGGGFFTCRLDQIELWKPTESYRFEILDVRGLNFEDLAGNSNVEIINNNKLLLL